MNPVRFVMIGGFLGAGKTTAIARLARQYVEGGLRVGIVTNDQAADLVDTHTFRAQGFAVEEVAGACFCCSFDTLVTSLSRLAAAERPDVLLAEPVGSCTDLAATVVRPIQRLYGAEYAVAPYVVLLKPDHGRRILTGRRQGGFSPKAAYIFEKQLEEADCLVLNKIDTLDDAQRDELIGLLRERQPDKPVLAASAQTGDGFNELAAMLNASAVSGRSVIDVDYDTYAEGEAELGWLNSTLDLGGDEPFDLDRLLVDLVGRIKEALAELDAETAHLKILGHDGAHTAVANLVAGDALVELSRPSGHRTSSVRLIVNARVAVDPDVLRDVVEATTAALAAQHKITITPGTTRHFRPARPVPTYRYAGTS